MKWTREEINILTEKYPLVSGPELLSLFPSRTGPAVRRQLQKLGIQRKQRKWQHNSDYFSDPNLENSYYAGFIAADGYIQEPKGKRNKFGMYLQIRDVDHLKMFKDNLGYDGPICYRYGGGYKDYPQCGITVNSAVKLCLDLEKNYNITPRKSLTLEPPNLKDEDLVKAFISGYIDGDGSLGISSRDRLFLSILGTKSVLEWIKVYFDAWRVNPSKNSNTGTFSKVRKKGNIWQYAVTGNQVKIVCNELLTVNVPRLTRKWNVVMEAKKQS